MQIIQDKLPVGTADFMVQTIGFFDGVHLGHQYLLEQVKNEALQRGLKSMVITFRNHPRKVLHPETNILLLTTLEEKLHWLEHCDIDYVALLDFTPQLSQMTAREYMEQVLIKQFNGRALVIGYDHHFGCKNGDGFAEYQAYGRELGIDIVKAQELPLTTQKDTISTEDLHASSTNARKALSEGDVETVRQILGRPYSICGTVSHGEAIGRTIGFPTANITINSSEKLLPKNGAYAVKVILKERSLPGMLYIGNRPTLEGLTQHRVEVHLLDFHEDIYGEQLQIEFYAFLRPEEHFCSMESLKKQLQCDIESVRNISKKFV